MSSYDRLLWSTIMLCLILASCGDQDSKPVSSEDLSSYKVYSGDGFSFRYPNNWEVGTSQLRTTRVLIRAKPEETGYAASCNVNASEVEGIEGITQKRLDSLNHKIHDRGYFKETVGSAMPGAQINNIDKHSTISLQPATEIEFNAKVRSPQIDTKNKFRQVVTIKKPYRYVLMCRALPSNYSRARPAFNLIMNTFYFE